jgi:flagellar protein FliO/FliZ
MPRLAVVIGLLLILPLLLVPAVQADEKKAIAQQVAPAGDAQQKDVSQVTGTGSMEAKEKKRSSLLTGDGEKDKYGMASGSLVNTAIGLVVVLAMIIGMAWLLRRFGGLPTVGKGSVSIVGGVSLGARERAVLLQVGDEQVLVGVAPGQVRALHVLGQKLVDPADKKTQKFSSQLDAAMKGERP